MSKKRLVYMSSPNQDIVKMFVDYGMHVTYDVKKADCVVFPGGPDVIPVLYGERPLQETRFVLNRDLTELKLYKGLPRSVPKVGICRGAQFLNVMCGGSLWQDVDGHRGPHPMYIPNGKRIITVTSTHHQMMRPASHAKVLGLANKGTDYRGDSIFKRVEIDPQEDDMGWRDPEVLFYKDEKALCFQPHPELMPATHRECVGFFFECFARYIETRFR